MRRPQDSGRVTNRGTHAVESTHVNHNHRPLITTLTSASRHRGRTDEVSAGWGFDSLAAHSVMSRDTVDRCLGTSLHFGVLFGIPVDHGVAVLAGVKAGALRMPSPAPAPHGLTGAVRA